MSELPLHPYSGLTYSELYMPNDDTHSDLDDMIDALMEDQTFYLDLVDEIDLFVSTDPSYHIRKLPRPFVPSQSAAVEQEDVLECRTDMQGKKWKGGSVARDSYRSFIDRIHSNAHQYHLQGPRSFRESRKDLDHTGNEFYRFRFTDTSVHCSHHHPQLRNLVCATSKNDVYYLYNNSIQHWCPQLRTSKTILGSPLKSPHLNVPSRITTMAALDDLLLVGGEDGSYTFMNLQTCTNPIYDSFTNGEHVEVNGIEISHSRTGGRHAFISTNDYAVKCVDLKTQHIYATYPTTSFSNYTSQSPDGHMIGVAGDSQDCLVMSVNSRDTIATLAGHQQFSFSVAWSPDSTKIATGSDDCSTFIYDCRMMADPLHILSSDIQESVRALRYSSCGRYLVMAEDRNYVHVVDAWSDYSRAQKIDLIGSISGISLTPDGDELFVGVSSPQEFSSIIEFEKSSKSGGMLGMDDLWSHMLL